VEEDLLTEGESAFLPSAQIPITKPVMAMHMKKRNVTRNAVQVKNPIQ